MVSKYLRLPVLGHGELKYMLDVGPARAQQLVAKADFPAPYARLRGGDVWRTEEVEAWAAAHGRTLRRLPGDWPPPRGGRPAAATPTGGKPAGAKRTEAKPGVGS